MFQMQTIQNADAITHVNVVAERFGTHLGEYAHGIVVIPEEVCGMCEVRNRYDKEYIYQALYRGGQLIDRNDPVLLRCHQSFIRHAHGRLLVTNAGLGGFLYRLLRKPDVVHITVVEPDYDVLELVEPSFSKFADKVTFVHAGLESVRKFETFDGVYLGKGAEVVDALVEFGEKVE